ncbi:MAG: hypothetical protein G3M78_03705 [Candidatus Nitrohelix vancouverensis]|uniref:Cytochrome c-type biogenesis protein H Ig-like domain-containing protein n=1 Tax=Candidatus Nitrohelix vancouverensis TaxID=2705534 RepID=A0A7T0G2P2_9BACT|nr:MAG: hypothetical protein G3M78_03705 [Candidatus Nitrohelix vancouverensis]
MKQLVLFCIFSFFFLLTACEQELKEHPMPIAMKRQIQQETTVSAQGQDIVGVITLDERRAKEAPENAVLFIVARPEGVTSGPPIAAKRFSLVKFPFSFSLGPGDVMRPGTPFEGKMTVTARLDSDGNAQPMFGDLFGTLTALPGDQQVEIALDQVYVASEEPSTTVYGTVSLDPSVSAVKEGAVLFLFARAEGVRRGPPIAAKRIPDATFPYEFSLGQTDTMMPNAVFDGKLSITARLDSDGLAGAGPDDLEAVIETSAGQKGVNIVIGQASPAGS